MKLRELLVAGGFCALSFAIVPMPLHAQRPQAAQEVPSDSEVEASAAALDGLDFDKLLRDRQYAGQVMAHVERLDRAFRDDPDRTHILDDIRVLAATTLERRDEAGAAIDRILARRSREPGAYAGSIYAAMVLEDYPRAVSVVETARHNVPGVGRADLRELFDADTMGQLLRELDTRDQDALRVRLAEALYDIGWPGLEEPGSADFLRSILLEDRLARGDLAAATALAEAISTPLTVLEMIVQPRYDSVLAPGRDRLELLNAVLAERDRATDAAIRRSPLDHKKVLDRAQFLHSVGRDADALAVLEPFTRDLPATVAGGEQGMWLINEAAYALVALGREDDAVALMRRLAELPMDEGRTLISARINYSEILWATGRNREALEYASELDRNQRDFASDYGDMWMVSSIVCALARTSRGAEAPPHIERLRALRDVNSAALTQAYLCLGDDDAAAAFMIERLQGDRAEDAILALQDYTLSRGVTQTGGPYDRLVALRNRPDVRAALDRVGRVYALPMARGYWGGF